MKKINCFLLLLSILLLNGCADKAAATQQQISPTVIETTEGTTEETISTAGRIDLTQMSSTMVMAQVSAMQYEPDAFMGKIVKMQGTFLVGYGDTRNYYYCLVSDATACCQQGFEFLWDGHVFPDDYPEPGTEIIVEGTFDTYWEDGYQYMQLVGASLEPV